MRDPGKNQALQLLCYILFPFTKEIDPLRKSVEGENNTLALGMNRDNVQQPTVHGLYDLGYCFPLLRTFARGLLLKSWCPLA